MSLKYNNLPHPTIDFTTPQMIYRIKHASINKEMVARVMGLKPKQKPFIIDATAGLGRDSMILSACGFQVTLIERSATLYTLLRQALLAGLNCPAIACYVQRLTLIHADSIQYLRELKQNQQPLPTIIYLDPMFPERHKSALVKKELRILQEWVGKDEDCDTLWQTALSCATKRVVVKRPKHAKSLGNKPPSFSTLSGRSNRFDIYVI
jgi:16S rRNA (guanine1516-N2)-methyltransferase